MSRWVIMANAGPPYSVRTRSAACCSSLSARHEDVAICRHLAQPLLAEKPVEVPPQVEVHAALGHPAQRRVAHDLHCSSVVQMYGCIHQGHCHVVEVLDQDLSAGL